LLLLGSGAEQGEAGKGAIGIVAAQAHAAPLYRGRFDWRSGWRCRRLSGRATGSAYRCSTGGDEQKIAAAKSSARC